MTYTVYNIDIIWFDIHRSILCIHDHDCQIEKVVILIGCMPSNIN